MQTDCFCIEYYRRYYQLSRKVFLLTQKLKELLWTFVFFMTLRLEFKIVFLHFLTSLPHDAFFTCMLSLSKFYFKTFYITTSKFYNKERYNEQNENKIK